MSNMSVLVDTNMIIYFSKIEKAISEGIAPLTKLRQLLSEKEAVAVNNIYDNVKNGNIKPVITSTVYEELFIPSRNDSTRYAYPVTVEFIKNYCSLILPTKEFEEKFAIQSQNLAQKYKDRKLFPKEGDNKDSIIMAQASIAGGYKMISLKNLNSTNVLTFEQQVKESGVVVENEAEKLLTANKLVTANLKDFVTFKVQEGRNTYTAREIIVEENKKELGEENVVTPTLPSEFVLDKEYLNATSQNKEVVEHSLMNNDKAKLGEDKTSKG